MRFLALALISIFVVGCDSYKQDVKSLIPPGEDVEFKNVKKFKSGVVCGMVWSKLNGTRRFVARPNGHVSIEINSPGGFNQANAFEAQNCSD